MKHRAFSRTVAAVAGAAALSMAAAAPALASAPSPVRLVPATAPARSLAVDPVGQYEWSLTMESMGNTPISGTLSVTRKDTALVATMTSDHTDGELAASSVKLDANVLTVISNGDFGQFAIAIAYADDGTISGSYKFTAQTGEAAGGALSIKRTGK